MQIFLQTVNFEFDQHFTNFFKLFLCKFTIFMQMQTSLHFLSQLANIFKVFKFIFHQVLVCLIDFTNFLC